MNSSAVLDAQSPVSVVVPAYNCEETIARALDSILMQSFQPHQIIVVDDGSTDSTNEVLTKYAKKIIIKTQSNKGAASARNAGASMCKTKYIAFLDADDCWLRDKLKYQIKVFRQIDGLALCWHESYIFTSPDMAVDWKRLSVRDATNRPVFPKLVAFDSIFMKPFLGTPNVMVKTDDFLSVGGFDENLKKAEDVDLWIRLSYGRKVAHLPEKLACVFRQKNCLSAAPGGWPYEYHVASLGKFLLDHSEFNIANKKTVDRAYSTIYKDWGRELLASGEPSAAREKLYKSLLHRINLETLYLLIRASYKMRINGQSL